MRHGMVYRKLGRKSAHRTAMFRNQLAAMIERERIITTLPKAKELRPLIEKMVTLGREDSVHTRRQASQALNDDAMVQKLFNTLGPRFASTPGGYTRIIKLGPRRGDGAEMAILEFTDFQFTSEKKSASPAAKKSGGKKAAPAADEAEAEEPEAEEKPKKKKPAAKKAAPKKPARAESRPKAKKSSSKKKR